MHGGDSLWGRNEVSRDAGQLTTESVRARRPTTRVLIGGMPPTPTLLARGEAWIFIYLDDENMANKYTDMAMMMGRRIPRRSFSRTPPT